MDYDKIEDDMDSAPKTVAAEADNGNRAPAWSRGPKGGRWFTDVHVIETGETCKDSYNGSYKKYLQIKM